LSFTDAFLIHPSNPCSLLANIIHADTSDITAHIADEEITVVLKDWYHGDYDDLMRDEFMNDKNPTGAEPV